VKALSRLKNPALSREMNTYLEDSVY
jgi:hypothetical protein